MPEEKINKDSYMNIKGTTCKSFTIGQKSISFASSAIANGSNFDNEKLMPYKTLVVKNDGNKKVIYDMDVPKSAIYYVSEKGGLTTLHLMDGTEIALQSSASGVQSDVTSEDPAKAGEIVTFADTTGKIITKSGFTFMQSSELPGAGIEVKTAEDLQKVADAYASWEASDNKVPTMKTVVDYVGSINDVLKLRLNGQLPIN